MRKRWVIVIAIAAALAVVVGIRLSKKSNGNGVPGYELATAEKKPLWIKVSATGLVEPVVVVEVKSKASGVVERLPIEMGDVVKRGQVIAVLDTTEIWNQLEQGRAAWAVATQSVRVREQALRRTEQLAVEGLVSEQDLENARLDLEKARSDETGSRLAVATLEEKYRDTVLRSPIDGIVLQKQVEVGQVISSGVSSYTGGTAVAVIADLTRVYVKADVDETDIGRVALGQRVEAVPDAFPDAKFTGAVERISPQSQIVQNVTTFEVVTALDNAEGILKSGMNVTVDILVAGRDQAITVPRRAVRSASEIPALAATLGIQPPQRPAGGAAESPASARPAGDQVAGQGNPNGNNVRVVCVKTGEGYAFRPVTIGLSDYDNYEVVDGIAEGDEVVVFVASRALDQSREFLERRRSAGVPGLSRSGGGGPH
jgi:HlyD family secretion protein